MRRQMELVTKMTGAAATASERLVPQPVQGVIDRSLVDVACVTNGGLVAVAERLRVDTPALDAWRTLGVPPEFRGPLVAVAMWPPLSSLRSLRTLPSLAGRRLAAVT